MRQSAHYIAAQKQPRGSACTRPGGGEGDRYLVPVVSGPVSPAQSPPDHDPHRTLAAAGRPRRGRRGAGPLHGEAPARPRPPQDPEPDEGGGPQVVRLRAAGPALRGSGARGQVRGVLVSGGDILLQIQEAEAARGPAAASRHPHHPADPGRGHVRAGAEAGPEVHPDQAGAGRGSAEEGHGGRHREAAERDETGGSLRSAEAAAAEAGVRPQGEEARRHEGQPRASRPRHPEGNHTSRIYNIYDI